MLFGEELGAHVSKINSRPIACAVLTLTAGLPTGSPIPGSPIPVLAIPISPITIFSNRDDLVSTSYH